MAMANRVGQKIFPRGARRQPMLPVGTCVSGGRVSQVRRQTAKYSRHYLVSYDDTFDDEWVRRDQVTVVPCE